MHKCPVSEMKGPKIFRSRVRRYFGKYRDKPEFDHFYPSAFLELTCLEHGPDRKTWLFFFLNSVFENGNLSNFSFRISPNGQSHLVGKHICRHHLTFQVLLSSGTDGANS